MCNFASYDGNMCVLSGITRTYEHTHIARRRYIVRQFCRAEILSYSISSCVTSVVHRFAERHFVVRHFVVPTDRVFVGVRRISKMIRFQVMTYIQRSFTYLHGELLKGMYTAANNTPLYCISCITQHTILH